MKAQQALGPITRAQKDVLVALYRERVTISESAFAAGRVHVYQHRDGAIRRTSLEMLERMAAAGWLHRREQGEWEPLRWELTPAGEAYAALLK